jgi:hypothetical protein
MTENTLEASVKLGMIEYALVASVDPCGSLLAEGIAECHYTGPQPVTSKFDREHSDFPHLSGLIIKAIVMLRSPEYDELHKEARNSYYALGDGSAGVTERKTAMIY